MFEQFEFDIMLAISDEFPQCKEQVMKQYENCDKKRHFTGCGFYTHFHNVDEKPLFENNMSTELGRISARINDEKCDVGFVLFIREGKIACLEGYTYEDAWPETIVHYSIQNI